MSPQRGLTMLTSLQEMPANDTRSLAKQSAVLIGALAVLTYWPMLLGRVPFPADVVLQFPPFESVRGRSFQVHTHAEMGDLVTEMYPWKTYTRRTALAATLPLWNPHLLLGTTFVGDPQPALFYPPTVLYALLPTPLAWSLEFLLRTVLAGALAALLARALGARGTAALASGVMFAFCAWVTAFQTRPHLDTVTWLALALFAVDRLSRRPTRSSVALTAAAFALPVLAGQPESAAHVTLVGIAFFLFRLAIPPTEGRHGRMRFVGAFAVAGLLALSLAAIQALPTLEFIGQLNRGLDQLWGPKPLHEIAAFLSRDLGATPNSAGIPIPEGAAYVGMLTLLLAPLALLHKNRRDAIFLFSLLAGVLSIVYGQGPVYWLSLRTPVLRGIPNGRLLAVADLSLAVLGGLGLSALCDELRSRARARPVFWLSAGAAFVIAAAGIGAILVRGRTSFRPHPILSLPTIRGPASSAAVLLTAALLLGIALAGRLHPDRIAAVVLAFCAADLVTASFRFVPFSRPSNIFPPTPTFDFLKRDPEVHRVAPVDGTYGAGFEMVYGLDSATGFNVIPRRTESVLSTLGTSQGVPSFRSERIVATPGRLLDLLNVKYLVATTWNRSAEILASRPDRFRLAFSDATVRVFENRTVLPRGFLVPASGIRVLPGDDRQLDALRDPAFDPATSVILPEKAFFQTPPPGASPAMSRVHLVRGEVDEVNLTADVSEPSVLVVSQTHYPGWHALVDGVATPLLRADYAFTGVGLAPGTHAVRLVYRPTTLVAGAIVSLFAAVVAFRLGVPGRAGSPLRAFSILVAAAALLTGIKAIRDRAYLFGAPPLRVFSKEFLGQVRALEARVPPGSVLLYVEPPSGHWSFLLWRRALFPRNEVILLESPLDRADVARLRSTYGIRYAIAVGDVPPDPGFLWSLDLGRTPHAADTRLGELAP